MEAMAVDDNQGHANPDEEGHPAVYVRNDDDRERSFELTIRALGDGRDACAGRPPAGGVVPPGWTTARRAALGPGEERPFAAEDIGAGRTLAVEVRAADNTAMVEYDPGRRTPPTVLVRSGSLVVVPGDPA